MKNKFILSFVLGIFLIGLVSAGITGYVLELRKGVAVNDDNLGRTSVQSVVGDTATFQFTDPNTGRAETLSGAKGQILTTSSGTRVEIESVKTGLFNRGARINVVPGDEASPVAKIASGGKALSWNGMSCSVYGAGQNNSLNGYDFCTGKGYGDYCLIHRQGIEDVYTNLSTGHKGPLFNGCGGAQNLLYTDNQYAPLTCDNVPSNYNWGCQNKIYKSYQDSVVCCKF